MKKMLFVLFLLLALVLSVPACAESAVYPADEDDLVSMTKDVLKESGFEHYEVTLNRKDKIIIVDVAIDGMTEQFLALKDAGYDETLEEWCGIKDALLSMHSSILEMFRIVHREDIRLIFQLANDDAFIREDYSTIRYSPLLSVGIFGFVSIDVMAE